MKFIIRNLLFTFLFISFSYSCSMCTTSIPIIDAVAKKTVDKENTTFDITWNFNKEFTKYTVDVMSKQHDDNNSMLEATKKTLEEYFEKNKYLTLVKYGKEEIDIDKIFDKSLTLKGGIFKYQFKVDINISSFKGENLSINFADEYNYFLFRFNDENMVTKVKFNGKNDVKEVQTEQNYFTDILAKNLNILKDGIRVLLKDIDEKSSVDSFFWLLLFSLGYGIVHAAGPGHGKSVISAYFLKDDYSYMKAFGMSGLIGLVHTFSAFILTFVVYFLLNNVLTSVFYNVEAIAMKVSAVIIILIALYLIYKKISKSHDDCSCSGCSTKKEPTDLAVVLAAGMVPCPGTVTIFIFTMSMGLYFLGFLSALFMSLGMSMVIFVAALLSIKVRSSSKQNETLIKLFEYGSLIFILFMGLFLFFV